MSGRTGLIVAIQFDSISKKEDNMIVSGIDRLFINVPDLAKALDFYHGIVGMKVVARGSLDSLILGNLWGLPKNVTGRSACVKNAKQPTAIELVELHPVPSEAARDNAKTYDYGLFDVSYIVSDAKKVERILKEKGYRFLTDPYRFPTWPGGIESTMGFVYGPAREAVGIVQLFNPLPSEEQQLDGDFWTMMDMAQIVESIEEATAFYRDALGLTVVLDNSVIPPGFFDTVLHLPKDTKPHVVLSTNPQSKGPVVETVEFSAKGKAILASPQKLGIFMIAFESSDLEDDLSKVRKQGFNVISGPVPAETSLHGKIKAADIEGPNKIRVELFQKVG